MEGPQRAHSSLGHLTTAPLTALLQEHGTGTVPVTKKESWTCVRAGPGAVLPGKLKEQKIQGK